MCAALGPLEGLGSSGRTTTLKAGQRYKIGSVWFIRTRILQPSVMT